MTCLTNKPTALVFSVDDLIEGVKSGGIKTTQEFENLCLEAFVAHECIDKEMYFRALAAIAARHNITVPELKERIAASGFATVKEAITQERESPHSDDLPDTEIVRAIQSA